MDAVLRVTIIGEGVTKDTKKKNGNRNYCAVVTLDIKHTFNSTGWAHIMQLLQDRRMPLYLVRIARSYPSGL